MQAWWMLLVMFHLVHGNQESFEDIYEREVNPNNSEESISDADIQLGTSYNLESVLSRRKRSSPVDERYKKQPKFHSWGGKRYEDGEDEDVRKSKNQENIPDEFLHLTYYASHPSYNESNSEFQNYNDFTKTITKRIKQKPAFSTWGGKRDPEVLDSFEKKSDFYNSFLQQDLANSFSPEQNIKRYPAFNSWAGKRAAAFNSWGGKRQAAFNSWGGKRQAAFNSWGGKRQAAFNSWGDKRQAAFNSWGGKRQAAFNSWGGKRSPAFNSWAGKRAAAFNSWGGKRQAAFNSWGGKRAAAFNSWGGKRQAAFNSWGGKRDAAFNSWGGKRQSAFNSWGGKRAAAFNSWGGKRSVGEEQDNFESTDNFTKYTDDINIPKHSENMLSENLTVAQDSVYNDIANKADNSANDILEKRSTAFNNWGGKRDAAFNSWGGKRDAAFNSWGGKRVAAFNSWGGKRVAAFNSWGGKRAPTTLIWPEAQPVRSFDNFKINLKLPSQTETLNGVSNQMARRFYNIKEKNNNDITEKGIDNNSYDGEILHSKSDEISDSNDYTALNKRESNNYFKMKPRYPGFSSWAGKRNNQGNSMEVHLIKSSLTEKRNSLFSNWYGNKIPTVQLSNGKRRPAFSSWGGKRSENKEKLGRKIECFDCFLAHPVEENEISEITDSEESYQNIQPAEETQGSRKKRDTNTACVASSCRNKRSDGNVKKTPTVTRMLLQGGVAWPLMMKSLPRGVDFYAWGGKRSL